MRWVCLFMAPLALMTTSVALCQDASQPTMAIIKQGKPAPFDGVLYNDTAFAQERVRQEQAQQRFDDKLKLELSLQESRLRLATSTTANALDATRSVLKRVQQIDDARVAKLEDELAKASQAHTQSDVWSDVKPFVIAAAVIALVIGGAAAVKDVRDAFRN